MCSEENTTLEPVEKRVEEELGRELTPREKFYLALCRGLHPIIGSLGRRRIPESWLNSPLPTIRENGMEESSRGASLA